jgi:hypothetical protein
MCRVGDPSKSRTVPVPLRFPSSFTPDIPIFQRPENISRVSMDTCLYSFLLLR